MGGSPVCRRASGAPGRGFRGRVSEFRRRGLVFDKRSFGGHLQFCPSLGMCSCAGRFGNAGGRGTGQPETSAKEEPTLENLISKRLPLFDIKL